MKQKLIKQALRYKQELKKHSFTAIASGIGFVIALSWRDFIVKLVDNAILKVGIQGESYFVYLISAVFVTGLGVIGLVIISKVGGKEK